MAKVGIVLAGQSNGFAGYAEDRVDQSRSHPNLWQFKQDGTYQQSPLLPLDHISIGNPNRVFVAYTYFWVRDYLIPRNPGVDYCILPQSVGGTGFTLWWHAPNAALTTAVGSNATGLYHETAVAQMNAFLAKEAGNTIGCFILQNGEQETGDAGSNIGYYHPSFSLTDGQAYTRYVTEMIADINTRVTGGRTFPFLIGQPPPELGYGPGVIGPAADGGDHSNSAYIPFFDAIKAMPSQISNCAYLDSLNPQRVYCHSKVMVDGAGAVIMDSGNYWVHTCQAGHHVMAHEADRKYSYLKTGKRIISMTYGVSSTVTAPEVPTIELASTFNDNRPDFNIGIPMTAQTADVIRVQANSVDYVTHTLVVGDFTAATINKTGIAALADGTYTFRARMERGSLFSAWSDTVSLTITTSLPVLTLATGSAASNTSALLSVSTTKANGTLYWVITASATKPTAAQVKTGKDNTGATALASDAQAVTATGVQNDTAFNLTTAGTRYAHFMHEDTSANQSVVATSASWTQVGGAWSIADLLPALWIDASDGATLFQNIAGTVVANTDGQPIGTVSDKSGNGFHLTATADDATRPTLRTGTYPYIEFDGTDDKLRRIANLALYSGGACSLFVAARCTGVAGRLCVVECSNTGLVEYMLCNSTTPTTLSTFIRADDSSTSIIGQVDITEPNAWDGTDNVVGLTDSSTVITSYMDGVSTDNKTYTRAASLVPTKFALGCELRSAGATFWPGRIYALVAVKRVLDSTERGKLVTALAAKMGRVL